MYYQRIFAQIFEETVQNVIVCDDYEMANYLSRATYGDTAVAVECNQYKVGIGCRYKEGTFYLDDGKTEAPYLPSQEEVVSKLEGENQMLHTAATFMAPMFTDEQALLVKELYPQWEDIPEGTHLEKDQRVRYGERLYKVAQAHDKQSTWTPPNTATLYIAIDESHAGTLEDPIPAVENMQYYAGKYYSEGDKVYLCIRDTGIPIALLPSALVGIYFEKAN